MPGIRTESNDPTRDYSGPKAHTFANGWTLATAAIEGSQASVANRAICQNAKIGVTFTAEDVLGWQDEQEGPGRSFETMPAHLESLVGKGFLVALCDCSYRLHSEEARGQPD